MNPFLVGHVMVDGFDSSGVLIVLGLTNMVLALVCRLPLVQLEKVVGGIAIANTRAPSWGEAHLHF